MATMQIRNVPADVHRVFRHRAVDAGQSLQEYMLGWLTEQARQPTQSELFARIAEQSGASLSLAETIETLRSDRDSR